MSKYIKGAITILICVCIVWAVRVFTYKNVSIRTFIKTKEVSRLWGELGYYGENGVFLAEKTFESEDIAETMSALNKYKFAEKKNLIRRTKENDGEIRFYFYLNEYETDVLYVTEENRVFTDIYGYSRSYLPHDEGLFEKLKIEFFMPRLPEAAGENSPSD